MEVRTGRRCNEITNAAQYGKRPSKAVLQQVCGCQAVLGHASHWPCLPQGLESRGAVGRPLLAQSSSLRMVRRIGEGDIGQAMTIRTRAARSAPRDAWRHGRLPPGPVRRGSLPNAVGWSALLARMEWPSAQIARFPADSSRSTAMTAHRPLILKGRQGGANIYGR